MQTQTLIPGTVTIPQSADNVRVIPTNAAQSAIFCVGEKGTREAHIHQKVLMCGGGKKITYSGPELRADDQDIFMCLAHFARGMNVQVGSDTPIDFRGIDMLRKLGWPESGHYYTRLADSLGRLQRASIRVEAIDAPDRPFVQGQLLRKFYGKSGAMRGMWRVHLEYEICSWIAFDPLTVDWDERCRLTKPLAKWIHMLMASLSSMPVFHAPLQTLMEICGSSASSLRTFRASVIAAAKQMKEQAVIKDFEIKGGVLYISRSETLLAKVEPFIAVKQFELAFAAGE